MDSESHTDYGGVNAMAVSATLHCLTGCAIGEILGLIIGTAMGLTNAVTIALSVGLAFLTDYLLEMGIRVRYLHSFSATPCRPCRC